MPPESNCRCGHAQRIVGISRDASTHVLAECRECGTVMARVVLTAPDYMAQDDE